MKNSIKIKTSLRVRPPQMKVDERMRVMRFQPPPRMKVDAV